MDTAKTARTATAETPAGLMTGSVAKVKRRLCAMLASVRPRVDIRILFYEVWVTEILRADLWIDAGSNSCSAINMTSSSW